MGTVTAADFPSGRWRARWIWCDVPVIRRADSVALVASAEPVPRNACLRRSLELARPPARIPARVTADSRYALFVNGVEVSRGPVRSNPRRLHYDLVDLGPYLEPGTNVIAAHVRFYGRSNPWWAPAPATLQLGAGCFLFEARLGADDWLLSDAEWRALCADAWEPLEGRGISAQAPEAFDARRLPSNWRERGFDDSRWQAARELQANSVGFSGRHEPPSHPYGPLLPRPIPQLGGDVRRSEVVAAAVGPRADEVADPVDQVAADLATAASLQTPSLELDATPDRVHVVTLDFGEVVAGTLSLDVEAPAGARLDLAAAERLVDGGGPDLYEQHAGLRYVARGSHDRFETLDSLGLRYAAVSIRASGPVRLRSLSVRERLFPRGEGPHFECSEPLLDRIWSVGRRTVDINSQDAYLDCPTREQRGWTGDFVVHQMVDLASNADWSLARWNVEMAASPRPDGMLPMAAAGDIEHHDPVYIPDWALHWIRALHNLYRYTGDRALVSKLMPVAERVLRWFVPFQADDGLLSDVTGWVIIDWSSVSVDGRSSVLNALFVRALRDFAEMADWLGDGGRAAWARGVAATVAAGFEAFWDPERELYVDHIADGRRGLPFSQHAQAAALCAGLVPAERQKRLVELLVDRERLVHATWSRASGDARFPAPGERGVSGPYLLLGPPPPWWDVERQIVAAQPFFRYVVHDALALAGREDLIPSQCLEWLALLERCETSLSETWYGGTTCHGWSSTPTRDLSTRTLGVTPAAPGFTSARVAPRLGPLAWARGALPTPYGLLSLDVNASRVEIESPVPFVLDSGSGAQTRHPPGRHALPLR